MGKKYRFNQTEMDRMYQNGLDDILEALDKGTINDLNIEVKIGEHQIDIPITADNYEIIFGAIKECIDETI